MSLKCCLIFAFALMALTSVVRAQDSSFLDKAISFPDKLFSKFDKRTSAIEKGIDRKTGQYLSKMERQEKKLKRKLLRRDTALAHELFDGVDEKYKQLQSLSAKARGHLSQYSGRLDSLSTTLKFLQGQKLAGADVNKKIQDNLAQFQSLQGKLDASKQIQTFLNQRQALLKNQFQKLGMVRQLKAYRKQVYYYQAQAKAYKQMLSDPNKIEEKLLSLVMKQPAFKRFFSENSQLASLFALPGGSSSSNPSASLQGLQTRASMNQLIAQRFGSTSSVTQQLQQNVQGAQAQLSALKNKVQSYSSGSYGNGEPEMPDFKPNKQKTKTFLERLEYGVNMQSQKARYLFPVTSDLGLSLGYKLNNSGIIGIGASYKIGWGRGWEQIHLTHQGISLRSYVDWKLKGSLYISGGYEQNYRKEIKSIELLKDYSAWQSSGLLGISKRYKVSGKLQGEMKLLWDFLSYQQIPKTQAVLFRIGYSLK